MNHAFVIGVKHPERALTEEELDGFVGAIQACVDARGWELTSTLDMPDEDEIVINLTRDIASIEGL